MISARKRSRYAAASANSVAQTSDTSMRIAMRRVEFRITSRAPRSCRETPRQSVPPEGQRRGAQSSVVEPGHLRPRDGGGQRLRALGGAEDAVDAVLHDVERAAAGQGDDRSAARQRLHGRDAEVLLARLQVQRARAVERAQALRAESRSRISTSDGASAARRASLGPAPDEDEPPAEQARGRDRVVEALVGHEGAHGQQEVAARLGRVGGAEEVDVDRRMQDPRRRGRSGGGSARRPRKSWPGSASGRAAVAMSHFRRRAMAAAFSARRRVRPGGK